MNKMKNCNRWYYVRMPMGYFSSNRLGEIASAVTTTISDIEHEAEHILSNIIVGVVHACVIIISFFNWRIGIISISAIFIGLYVNSILQKRSIAVSPKRQEAQIGLITAILEYIQGIAVIKAFGLDEKSNRAVDDAIAESCKRNIGMEEAFIKLISFYVYVFKVASCAILMMACYLFMDGEFSLVNTLMIIVSSFVIYSQIEAAGSTSSWYFRKYITILNNIKFGRPEVTMEEVIESAKKACCYEFICNLPDGYNTVIGEGGGSLSGGEKQRISIARAILKDAPIIILDEATSSVDPENERELQLAIMLKVLL